MALQSVETGLDGAGTETGIRTGLIEAKDVGTEEKALVPAIGGQQIDPSEVVVTPASGTLDISDGDEQQLASVITDQQSREMDVTKECEYESATPAVVTVDENGLVEPVSAGGPINITATALGSTDTYAATVQD